MNYFTAMSQRFMTHMLIEVECNNIYNYSWDWENEKTAMLKQISHYQQIP